MTKRGKKRSGKRNSKPHQSEGEVTGQHSDGQRIDFTFFGTSVRLYGELHQRLHCLNRENYTEESVMQIGRQMLHALDDLAKAVSPQSRSQEGSCPFVMLLSMLLPTLRKYLAWTQATRSLWRNNFQYRSRTSGDKTSSSKGVSSTVLWAMLAQHNILSRFSLQTAHIVRLTDSSKLPDGLDQHPTAQYVKTSQVSPASSCCSSAVSTPRDSADPDIFNDPPAFQEKPDLVSQIRHISVELANVNAEGKVQLADLTESFVEAVEMISKHMCIPIASKDAGKSWISASQFIERLVKHLLEPMGQRMLVEPSASYLDLFPRLLEQCISVTIDNFTARHKNRHEHQVAPFEAGVAYLRTWSLKFENEYNTLTRSSSSSNEKTHSSLTLNLMALNGFKRLENTVSFWLRAASSDNPGPDLASGYSARLSSVTGGFRSTLSGRTNGHTTGMENRKRQRVDADVRHLELCADDLRQIGASIGSCQFRQPSTNRSVPLKSSGSPCRLYNASSKSTFSPAKSLYSVISSSAYATKTSASNHQDTWQTLLHRLAMELFEKTGSKQPLETCERLTRRVEALSDTVRLCQERTGGEVAVQDRVEMQLALEEKAWMKQMQIREKRVVEREEELQSLKEENATVESQDAVEEEAERSQEEDQDEQAEMVELAELREALALRAEEKRDIEAAISSLERKKARRQAAIAEQKKKNRAQVVDVQADAVAAAREQVLRELREEKEMLQREIIAAEEMEENLEENVRDLPALKEEVANAKRERAKVQTHVDSLRLELARQKRKMRHMVDVQLLTARDTNPPTLREEAVLLHLLYEHEGEMGVNELKQEASEMLKDHGKPNGNGVVIRALYSLVANGLVQIDRSYGNGLVTLLLV